MRTRTHSTRRRLLEALCCLGLCAGAANPLPCGAQQAPPKPQPRPAASTVQPAASVKTTAPAPVTFTFRPVDGMVLVERRTREIVTSIGAVPQPVDVETTVSDLVYTKTSLGWDITRNTLEFSSTRDGKPWKNPAAEVISGMRLTLHILDNGQFMGADFDLERMRKAMAKARPDLTRTELDNVVSRHSLEPMEQRVWDARFGHLAGRTIAAGLPMINSSGPMAQLLYVRRLGPREVLVSTATSSDPRELTSLDLSAADSLDSPAILDFFLRPSKDPSLHRGVTLLVVDPDTLTPLRVVARKDNSNVTPRGLFHKKRDVTVERYTLRKAR